VVLPESATSASHMRLDLARKLVDSCPPELATKIIRDNTEVWVDPHVPGVRFGLTRRNQRFALSMRLQWDIQNLLRVLWAINRRWDQDWKWTDERALDLPIKPKRLSERIDAIFELRDLVHGARECLQLVLDGLALVPPEHDVSAAVGSIKATLEAEAADRPIGRVCGAIIRDEKIVMVHCDHKVNSGSGLGHAHWTLPGDRLDEGESPEEAVLREVREETGMRGEVVETLFDRLWSKSEIERCFLIKVSPEQEPILGSDPELAGRQQLDIVAWRSLDEVKGDPQVKQVLEALKQRGRLR
jgi:NUDIX domain